MITKNNILELNLRKLEMVKYKIRHLNLICATESTSNDFTFCLRFCFEGPPGFNFSLIIFYVKLKVKVNIQTNLHVQGGDDCRNPGGGH